jgi:hypothetical protein
MNILRSTKGYPIPPLLVPRIPTLISIPTPTPQARAHQSRSPTPSYPTNLNPCKILPPPTLQPTKPLFRHPPRIHSLPNLLPTTKLIVRPHLLPVKLLVRRSSRSPASVSVPLTSFVSRVKIKRTQRISRSRADPSPICLLLGILRRPSASGSRAIPLGRLAWDLLV